MSTDTKEESRTPRTDAYVARFNDPTGKEIPVSADFARQLETELAEAKAEIERLRAVVESLENDRYIPPDPMPPRNQQFHSGPC